MVGSIMKKIQEPRKISCEENLYDGMSLNVLLSLIENILERDSQAMLVIDEYDGTLISYYRFETPEEVDARVKKDAVARMKQKAKRKLEKELEEKIERETLKRLQKKYGCDTLEIE